MVGNETAIIMGVRTEMKKVLKENTHKSKSHVGIYNTAVAGGGVFIFN